MPRFSIVTPSYNSGKYMKDYFQSLEKQTFKDFEIVIIDDCSTDDTYEIISKYVAHSDLDVKLLKNHVNRGPGYTRNRGMNKAEGKWLLFVDSDDSIEPELLEKSNSILESNKRAAIPINCIVFDYSIVSDTKKSRASSVYGYYPGGIIPVREAIYNVRNHVCGKIYNASLLKKKKVCFPPLKRCEDVAFTCQAIDACCMDGLQQIGTVFYLKETFYNYFQRNSSLSNNKNLDAKDMVDAYRVLNNKLGNKYHEELWEKSISDLLYGGVLMKCKAGMRKAALKRFITSYEKRNPDWYKCRMVHKIGKAKLLFLICIKKRWYLGLKLLTCLHSKMIG